LIARLQWPVCFITAEKWGDHPACYVSFFGLPWRKAYTTNNRTRDLAVTKTSASRFDDENNGIRTHHDESGQE
jgi:hypothetical protein